MNRNASRFFVPSLYRGNIQDRIQSRTLDPKLQPLVSALIITHKVTRRTHFTWLNNYAFGCSMQFNLCIIAHC